MFTTRNEVTNYLVNEQGKPANFVKILVNEYLNYDTSDNDKRDYVWRFPDFDVKQGECELLANYQPLPDDCNEDVAPVQVSKAWCEEFYNNNVDWLELTETGIKFDGDECFDLNGNHKSH